MSSVEIVPTIWSDAELTACWKLDERALASSWPLKEWLLLAHQSDYYLFLLKRGSRVEGFALWKSVPLDNLAHLLKIVVSSDGRGKGWGYQLLDTSVSYFAQQFKGIGGSCYLEVEADNSRAIYLYKKYGFQQLHRVKKFYSTGADALIFSYALSSC